MDTGRYRSLMLTDEHMWAREPIFAERAGEGWSGNGYDWASVAQVVVAEQLADVAHAFSFDPEAGMFSASGPRAALERLGAALHALWASDDALRDVLARAELD
ncbi:hypothetical protein F8S13_18615 [Chloroflexia bacterium SDU3-3]|nr:hypothetical protein F8S13_18615 [Chloroflexia bacterium SDU3-3]